MIGLLKTLAIIAFIYYAIKFISPYIKRYALKKVGETLEKKMHDQFGNQEYSQSNKSSNDRRKEGEVRVDGKNTQKVNPDSKSKHYNTQNMGEYIDYEEVNE